MYGSVSGMKGWGEEARVRREDAIEWRVNAKHVALASNWHGSEIDI